MEEERLSDCPEEEGPKYHPRPAYQVWAARIGLVIVIVAVLLYYWQIAQGGR